MLIRDTPKLRKSCSQSFFAKVLVENDHKPLEIILKKSLHDAPPRLQRMLLRLQKYDFVIKHKPGKDLVVADTLSRAPLPDTDPAIDKEISCYVYTLLSTLPVTDEMMARLKRATSEDESLQQLRKLRKLRKFTKDWNFNHVTTSPYHPQANGPAEIGPDCQESIN